MKEQLAAKEVRLRVLREGAAKILVTTTGSIDGRRVAAYLGVECTESTVLTFNGHLTGDECRSAEQDALEALKILAVEKGADAVVGLGLSMTRFSEDMLILALIGTLVRLEPVK
ncbi:MAG TPA: heavy metal-binding domain-containing protein [Myxococcota bacterium]|nr:heavy metal-binding domain-containing protein [Myxococcota bacterium]HRY92244.1 heavy metal-binding domain-containing protein [Myxococcota bacterium]